MTDRASAEGLRTDHSDALHRAGYRADCPACIANDAAIAADRVSAEGLREAATALVNAADAYVQDYENRHPHGEPLGDYVPLSHWEHIDRLRTALRSSERDSGLDVEAIIRTLQAAPYHWNESITHDLREVLSTTETSDD